MAAYITSVASLVAYDKESTCQCRRHGFDPWVKKIPWRGTWQPMDRGTWWATVHGVAESDMTWWLNNNIYASRFQNLCLDFSHLTYSVSGVLIACGRQWAVELKRWSESKLWKVLYACWDVSYVCGRASDDFKLRCDIRFASRKTTLTVICRMINV